MEKYVLSLRKRKLLDYLKNTKEYVTSSTLAEYLQVSARTIRNDINEINENLQSFGIQILSKPSVGYLLFCENESSLKKLNQVSSNFLSREDRIRHIAFTLCFSDIPVDLYDLEDEMFISRTTLENDLIAFRKKYVLPEPHIEFFRHKNRISFEQEERKRRIILNLLFSENWNYNDQGNLYYEYQYIDETVIGIITAEIRLCMQQYNIIMDDINIVMIVLAIAIAYSRIKSGHSLTDENPIPVNDNTIIHAVNDLLNILEEKLDCNYSNLERSDLYLHVYCSRLLDASKLNFGTIDNYFNPSTIEFANSYLRKIKDTYSIDFSDDEDFYITLLQYLRYLTLPLHFLNSTGTHTDGTRSKMLIEYEIAFLIQDLSLQYTGNYLDYSELMYLAFCISGAMEARYRNSPKLKTVIMCHMNLPATWNLKQRILNNFNDSIDLIALLPVYMKDNYDFSKIDLVITTANKHITSESNCDTLLISSFFPEKDQQDLRALIFHKHLNRLYNSELPSIRQLFENAFWHEKIDTAEPFSIIETLSMDFISKEYVSYDYLHQVLRREAIMTFAFQPSIVLLYSLVPSNQTCLSIATLNHRIKWNSYKIRTVIMAAIAPQHTTLIFRLFNELFYGPYNINDTRFLKTKQELITFFTPDR